MSFHACFLMLHRASGTKTIRMVAVILILAVPISVAAGLFWNSCDSADAMTESDNQSRFTPRRSVQTGPMEIRELQARVSVSPNVQDYGNDPIAEMRRQEEEALSVVFYGQMIALPAVAMAQRHMIDGAVNQHRDTLLHVACQSGNQLAVWLLIEAGASTTVKNRFEETPLDVARGTDAHNETFITTMIRQRLIPARLTADPAAHQG